MNWYNNYGKEWKEIIKTVASELGRTEIMIEKDTIQSMFLFELSKSDLPFVFKCGTSLSKAYNLIDRFSEDIDLSMKRKLTEAEKKASKKLITEIATQLGMTLINYDAIKSRYDYNKYIFKYESLFDDIPLEIIIETNCYQSVIHEEKHEIGSFVGRFCDEMGIVLPIPFKADKFYMSVQTINRTFVDKIFAICDYRIHNMSDRDSRHLYDIFKLMEQISLDDNMKSLVDEIRNDRMHSKNNPSAQQKYNIPEMLEEIIQSRFYESDYKNITQKLLYENVDYESAVKNGIEIVAKSDVFSLRKNGENIQKIQIF